VLQVSQELRECLELRIARALQGSQDLQVYRVPQAKLDLIHKQEQPVELGHKAPKGLLGRLELLQAQVPLEQLDLQERRDLQEHKELKELKDLQGKQVLQEELGLQGHKGQQAKLVLPQIQVQLEQPVIQALRESLEPRHPREPLGLQELQAL
jgi:hypothetical protein